MAVLALEISPYAANALKARAVGHVHSVFSTSANIELAGRLVHLGGDAAALSCLGLSVPAGATPALLCGLRAGDEATVRDGQLRLYSRAGVRCIELAAAKIVGCDVPHMDEGAARWALARLDAGELRAGSGLPDDPRTDAALAQLAAGGEGTFDTHDQTLVCAVDHLVGRGQGLTPSGDDVLLGFACALEALGQSGELAELLLSRSRDRTTDVSTAYFDAFACGYANPVYGELARSALARDEERFSAAVRQIERIGHTSGTDALLGLSLGFARTVQLKVVEHTSVSPARAARCA